jgi:glycosyltransferase involved in cell wall biosynthesis
MKVSAAGISKTPPKVSWLLCANRDDFLLHRAIESCLSQTFENFELLIVVNGIEHSQISSALSQAYRHDDRVVVIPTRVHLLNFSLSLGLHLARAPFVARMDADDVSAPERLSTQLSYMERNEDIVVLGTSYNLIDSSNRIHGSVDLPETDFAIRRELYYRNPICHPTVMFRRDIIQSEGGYLGGRNAEDYDLWLRLASNKKYRFANLPLPLLSYNVSTDGEARRSRVAYANLAALQVRQFLITWEPRYLSGSFLNSAKCFFVANRS